MRKPEISKSKPPDTRHESLVRLDADLASFEASRKKAPGGGMGAMGGAESGFNLLGQMLGGILGGVGLGWTADHYAHTGPWGLVIGLFAGAVLSIWSTIRMASRGGASSSKEAGAKTVTKGSDTGSRDEA